MLVILNDSDECLIIYSSKNNTSVDNRNSCTTEEVHDSQ